MNFEYATFICGHRKSGTTLLLCLLDNHPEVLTFPVDSAFFYGYYPAFDSPAYSDHQKIERMAFFVLNKLEIELFNLSETDRKALNLPLNLMRNDFRAYAAETEKTPRDMLISLMRAYWKHFKGSEKNIRWLEKTTSSEIYASEILNWFPQAKFIHVIRDPRDNWASLKSGWSKLYYKFNDSPDRLMHQMIERGKLGMEFARNNLDRFGSERYKIIKFEDLTDNPKETLNEICDFLKIKFSESLLTPTVCGKLWKGNNYSGVRFEKPSALHVGRWRERITADDARLIEYHFGSLMKSFSYQTIYPMNERMDAATRHYKAFDAKNLTDQLCPGVFKAVKSGYSPEWRSNPMLFNPEFQDGIFIFKITLGEICRRIAVPAQTNLEQFSMTISEAFEFDHEHLYVFTYTDRGGRSVDVHHTEMNVGPPWVDEMLIGELPVKPGSRIRYLYDFSDNWEFDIKLEHIEQKNSVLQQAIIIESDSKSLKQYP